MNVVFSSIENISQNPEYNIFRIFQCESVRRCTSIAIKQLLPPSLQEAGQRIDCLVSSWFDNPTQEKITQIANHIKLTCYRSEASAIACNAIQIGLLAVLAGIKLEKHVKHPFRQNESNQLLQSIEQNANALNQPENQNRFVTYGIDLYGSECDETKDLFRGHAFTLVQYFENGAGVRYRLFQSYLGECEYSLNNCIALEKEKHQPDPDGSFSHEECLSLIESMEKLLATTIWSEQSDALYRELFGVSLPNLLGKKITIPCFFCYKFSSHEKFKVRNDKLLLISEQMKCFYETKTLSEADYRQLLVKSSNGLANFEPAILSWTFENLS